MSAFLWLSDDLSHGCLHLLSVLLVNLVGKVSGLSVLIHSEGWELTLLEIGSDGEAACEMIGVLVVLQFEGAGHASQASVTQLDSEGDHFVILLEVASLTHAKHIDSLTIGEYEFHHCGVFPLLALLEFALLDLGILGESDNSVRNQNLVVFILALFSLAEGLAHLDVTGAGVGVFELDLTDLFHLVLLVVDVKGRELVAGIELLVFGLHGGAEVPFKFVAFVFFRVLAETALEGEVNLFAVVNSHWSLNDGRVLLN